MKARFLEPQPPVKIVKNGSEVYLFVCLNGEQKTEEYPDACEGQGETTYYEYDYNEISGPEDEIPIDDIQVHPENYLDYIYKPAPNDPGEIALEKISELENVIERGLSL